MADTGLAGETTSLSRLGVALIHLQEVAGRRISRSGSGYTVDGWITTCISYDSFIDDSHEPTFMIRCGNGFLGVRSGQIVSHMILFNFFPNFT